GYYGRYKDLERRIKEAVPDADVSGSTGGRGDFEVKVNDTLIFSKQVKGGFPVFEEVVEIVLDVAKGQSPRPVENSQKSSCVIV
ncbi:migration and invasion enhancer 1-like, partial [Sycon ciliatum]|uniref:migration and invasion enhancer 1-like n=1 Tax=Sycon ciliatum TaxID=27933 RepID=UPI0031F5F644